METWKDLSPVGVAIRSGARCLGQQVGLLCPSRVRALLRPLPQQRCHAARRCRPRAPRAASSRRRSARQGTSTESARFRFGWAEGGTGRAHGVRAASTRSGRDGAGHLTRVPLIRAAARRGGACALRKGVRLRAHAVSECRRRPPPARATAHPVADLSHRRLPAAAICGRAGGRVHARLAMAAWGARAAFVWGGARGAEDACVAVPCLRPRHACCPAALSAHTAPPP